MKTKNLLAAGVAGAVVNYLLGWVFYGMLFKDSFPQPEESVQSLLMIFLGCLTLGLFMAYIFIQWAQISTGTTGAKAGAVISLFVALYYDFFQLAMNSEVTYQMVGLDVILMVVMGAITGAVIGAVNGKMG
ncbi:hypothetical protein [Aestuariivivens sediminis]|uniref:hypothetical protein n=1 Tax=Aestuariivivens sediminis TaxID=2913557 RepID=UPI001F5696F4|nr:hypothetical protein [Aestuariivivens sediminis]